MFDPSIVKIVRGTSSSSSLAFSVLLSQLDAASLASFSNKRVGTFFNANIAGT